MPLMTKGLCIIKDTIIFSKAFSLPDQNNMILKIVALLIFGICLANCQEIEPRQYSIEPQYYSIEPRKYSGCGKS